MNLLHQIYTELYGPLDAPGRKKHLEELAITLSKIAGREARPWGWRYLNNILFERPGFKTSAELTTALQVLAGRIDGRPALADQGAANGAAGHQWPGRAGQRGTGQQ